MMPIASVASPAYLKKHGTPRRVADLARHRLVRYAQTFGARAESFEYFDGTAYREIEMPVAITVNNGDAYQAACLAGLGIIQAPRMGVAEALAAGRLVEVLPAAPPAPMPVQMLYAHRRYLAVRVRSFMDWLAEVLREALEG
jgi:DNA-binding transcriptional LysR family regulator